MKFYYSKFVSVPNEIIKIMKKIQKLYCGYCVHLVKIGKNFQIENEI